MKKKIITPVLAIALVLSMALAGCGSNTAQNSPNPSADTSCAASVQTAFAGGSGTADDPYQVATANQLDAIRNNLKVSYILTADVDMSVIAFEPVGTFEPKSEAEEDSETPKDSAAFTGYFDGDGHTVSNLTIDGSGHAGVGMFGCITGDGAGVSDLTLENLTVIGGNYTGGVVGYGYYDTIIKDITLTGENKITGAFLVGGIVVAAHCDVVGCDAAADVVLLGESTQGAGIVVGGEEDGRVENCTATGSVTAGNGCFSVGGLAGCFHNSANVKNCMAENISITVGENSWLIGGLVGHAGTFEGSPTAISGCTVKNVAITAADTAERIGGIVGGGFYGSTFAQYYAEPSSVTVTDCSVSYTIVTGGKLVGSVLGYAYNNSKVNNCTVAFKWNGDLFETQIGADVSVSLDKLC